MEFAVHYSRPLATLIKQELVPLDRFKCPAWPDLLEEVKAVGSAYVHFPLRVGAANGGVINTETNAPVDWNLVETLLSITDTPYVNVHLSPLVEDYPQYSIATLDSIHVEIMIDNAINGIEQLVDRFGADKIIVENDHHSHGATMQAGYAPHVLRSVLEATGTGFLFDISHARLAARHLGIDERDYIEQLPVDRIREIHITGIHKFEGDLVEKARTLGVEEAVILHYEGAYLDHLPMTEADYEFFGWCLNNIQRGHWHQPWVISFEYGGVGGLWELIADAAIYKAQLPRLYGMIQSYQPVH